MKLSPPPPPEKSSLLLATLCLVLGRCSPAAAAVGEILRGSEDEVDRFANIVSASGKFGGVAGVFVGVRSCNKECSIVHGQDLAGVDIVQASQPSHVLLLRRRR